MKCHKSRLLLIIALVFVSICSVHLFVDIAGADPGPSFCEIHGTGWYDINRNGTIDDHENGIGSQIIYLDRNQNNVREPDELFTSTAADGSYSFFFLTPGTYTVAEEIDPNWPRTFPGTDNEVTLFTDESTFLQSAHVDSTETFDEYPTGTVLGSHAEAIVDSVKYIGYYSVSNWCINVGYGSPGYISAPNAMTYNGIEVEGCALTLDGTGYVHSLGFWILMQGAGTGNSRLEIIVEDINQHQTSYEVNCTSDKVFQGFTSIVGIKKIIVHGLRNDIRPNPWSLDHVSRSAIEFDGQWRNEHSLSLSGGQVVHNVDFGSRSLNPLVPCDPEPQHNAMNVSVNTDLVWFADGLMNYDVYFGTDPEPGCGEYLGTTNQTTWDLPILEPNTTYYWRLISWCTSGYTEGTIWQFTTAGCNTIEYKPYPPDLSIDNPLNVDLSWGEELVSNGGFESGNEGWLNSIGRYPIIDGLYNPEGPDEPSAANSGNHYAISEPLGPSINTLYQDISIPAVASNIELSWYDRIRNYHTEFVQSQQMFHVEIQDRIGNVLANAFCTNPGDQLMTNWTQRHFDLTAFKGQDIRLAFVVEANFFYLNIGIDDVSVKSTGYANYDVYFGTNQTPGPNEYQGSTTDTTWNLPVLEPATTYFWQIIANDACRTVSGPIWRFSTDEAVPIGDAKLKEDGAMICTKGIITAVFSDRFYIETPQRISGLCVYGFDPKLKQGVSVQILGILSTNQKGERSLTSTNIVYGGFDNIRPLGLANKAIGGADLNYNVETGAGQKGISGIEGLNNIGLLVRTWGVVTAAGSIPRGPVWFYLDDGSSVQDGTGIKGIYVESANIPVPSIGSCLQVTGISSCEYYNSKLVNILLPRSEDDIIILNEAYPVCLTSTGTDSPRTIGRQ